MQRKEEDMLAQQKMPDGEKEELSQVRMFCCLKYRLIRLPGRTTIFCCYSYSLSVCLHYNFCGVNS
jgi:hypothetical protein